MIKGLSDRLLSRRIYLLLIAHVCISGLSYWLAYQLRFDFALPAIDRAVMWTTMPWVVAVKLLVFHQLGSFHGWWRYVTFEDLAGLLRVATVSALIIIGIDYFLLPRLQIPRSVLLLDWGCTVLVFGGLRSAWRLVHEGVWATFRPNGRNPALLVGADESGISLARHINNHSELDLRIVGFLDENESHHGSRLGGLPIVGSPEAVVGLADRYDVQDVLVTAGTVYGDPLRELVSRCRGAKIRLNVIPSMDERLHQTNRLRVRDVDINDVLRREPVQLDGIAIDSMLSSRRVMVTGAGGSIGSEMCRQIARCHPACLILVERAENNLFQIEHELRRGEHDIELAVAIADVRDDRRMSRLFEQHHPEVVFHAAAHKHVPLSESNPGEAIASNVLGARQMVDLAHAHGVERFVFISTDKAVNPASIMGASKQLAERYVEAASVQSATKFVVVRFGNVLASSGSAVPIFQEQIRRGGPITVTHPEMERYFMTIPEASQLVLQAAAMGNGGEVFVLDMGEPVRIVDLARDLIHLSGLSEEDIKIVFTGPRPGEKLNEKLLFSEEEMLPTAHPKLHVARPRYHSLEEVRTSIDQMAALIYADDDLLRDRLAELLPEYTPTGARSSPRHPVEPSR